MDQVLCTAPNTTLIVAQIIESGNGGTAQRIPTFNAAIPALVADRVNKGFKVLTIDMSDIGANGASLG